LAVAALAFLWLLTPASAQGKTVLVVAPHPDDDLLYAAGVVARAHAAGDTVKVVYMTNGDFGGGQSAGLSREAAAVAGQAILGTTESDLLFLGYPDGGLLDLLENYASSTSIYTNAFGQSVTYGAHGLGSTDYHNFKFGSHASYNAANVVADLQAILATYRPDDIYTTSELDSHPDHQATYWFVKDALLAQEAADSTYHATLHKTIVHWLDDTSWPAPVDPQANVVEPPGLPQTGFDWNNRESLVVPAAMQTTDLTANPKYLAIQQHSVGDPFLDSFVHKDEVFWTDPLTALPSVDENVAPLAAVMASSQDTQQGQLAVKAVDGVVDGYPGDSSREWATAVEGAGSSLELAWPDPIVVSRIVLHDRPNANDQVTAATLQFSDGSSLSTGTLPNDGSALTLSFAAKTITSVQFSVTGVSSTTGNVGLAEIEVYGHAL
jgi:LmbE family N-acetylglucosaminyl deacetylase